MLTRIDVLASAVIVKFINLHAVEMSLLVYRIFAVRFFVSLVKIRGLLHF